MRGRHLKDARISQYYRTLSYLIILNLLLSLFLLVPFLSNNSTLHAARPDEVEPNDSFNNATDIADKTYSGNVDQNDEVDYYKVALAAGQTLSVEYITDPSGNKTSIILYNGDLNELWNSGWLEHSITIYFNYTINRTINGPYYLGVWAENNGNMYDLSTTITSQNDGGSGTDASDIFSNATLISVGTNAGFLAKTGDIENEDVVDYYQFIIPKSKIAEINLSASGLGDGAINFGFMKNNSKIIKTFQSISPGAYKAFRYTNNGSGSITHYFSVNIVSGRNNYNISIHINQALQDDGKSGHDAGSNQSALVTLEQPKMEYKGWLGGGNLGNDQMDLYKIVLQLENKSVNISISITPDSSLDIVVNLYNDLFGLIKYLNPLKGAQVNLTYISTEFSSLYLELKVDGNSDGEYRLTYSTATEEVDLDSDNLPDKWEIKHFGNINNSTADEDPDDDDLKNLNEYTEDTDPNCPDSDNDSIPDGWEVQMGLDPVRDDSSEDPDADEYSNYQEFLNHTDPKNAKSRPLAGFDHLTTEACERAYTDAKQDVRFLRGYIDNVTDEEDIIENKIGDYPNFDLISLDSNRVDNELVVVLKVKGKIDDSGTIESEADESEYYEMTYYWIGFVDKDFIEPKMDGETGLVYVDSDDPKIKFPLIYINNTFGGTPSTKGKKIDNGQTLEWRVPLAEIADVPANFNLYGVVYHLQLTGGSTRAKQDFEVYFDSLGMGSIDLSGSKPDITVEVTKSATIEEHKIEVSIDADGTGGVISIQKATKPSAKLPAGAADLGIYINIELTGGVEAKSIFFTIEYNDSDIPDGFFEKDIKIFYYDETQKAWTKVSNSGVWTNNNTVWARPNHLTIFAPLAKPGEDADETTDIFLYLVIIIIIIIVVIIIVVVVAIIRSKRRARRPPARPAAGPRRALSPEFLDCPRCGEGIEIPYTETQKVALECPHCGGKGKIENPYLKKGSGRADRRGEDYDRGYDSDRGFERDSGGGRGGREVDIDYKPPRGRAREQQPARAPAPEDDYEYKPCPKCHKRIPIPYEDTEKIVVRCPKCGAKGKITNPYLK